MTCIALLKNEQGQETHLLTGSWDKTVCKWDLRTESTNATCTKPELVLRGHSDFVKSLVIFGNTVFTASSDATIRQWDLSTGKELKLLKGHKRGVEALAVDLESGILYSGSSDTTIKRWDAQTGQCLFTFEGHLTSVYDLTLTDEGQLFSGLLSCKSLSL